MEKGTCSKRNVQSYTKKKYPDFFQVYFSELNSRTMPIPRKFIAYVNDMMPMKAILRCNGRVWIVKMVRIGRDIIFQEGWEGFVMSNNLQDEDFLIFSHDGGCIFDVVIFRNSRCVKEEVGDKVLPEVKIEQDDSDVKDAEEEHEEYVVNDGSEERDYDYDSDSEEDKDYVPSDGVHSNQEEVEEDYVMSDDDLEENINNTEVKTKHNDQDNYAFGDDLNMEEGSQWYRRYLTDDRNPFFLAKLRPKQNRNLCVPAKVIKYFNLELPSKMSFLDPLGRKWKGNVKKWRDGRTVIGGWKNFCKWNWVTHRNIMFCEILEECECIRVSIVSELDC